MPLMQEYAPGMRVEALFDRLCVRAKAFGKPTAEAWHRDMYDPEKYVGKHDAPLRPLQEGDFILGGWLNCNTQEPQYFSFVPGTHLEPHAKGGGFALEKEDFSTRRTRLTVPPGHVVVFLQGLVHEVVSGVQPVTPSIRLFTGHRVTRDTQPLYPDLAKWIDTQAVPRLPSGQRPPMFSPWHHTIKNGKMLDEWSQRMFRPEFLLSNTPSRFMHSLRAYGDYGREMLPPYTEDERRVMWPE